MISTAWRAALCVAAALTLAAGAPRGSAAEDHEIVQRDKAFSQERITLRAGDRIVFKNEDTVSHNVFSRSPGSEFEVRAQLPGQESPVVFAKPGEAEVRCAIHPAMRLRVTVTPKE
jgi:plastocyanin